MLQVKIVYLGLHPEFLLDSRSEIHRRAPGEVTPGLPLLEMCLFL